MQRWLIPILWLALPASAAALELNLSLAAGATYDDNVFNEESSKHRDIGVTLQPSLGADQRFSRGQTSLHYSPVLEHYFLQQDIRANQIDVNHFGTWDLSYALGPRTSLRLGDRIESTLNHDFDFERDAVGAETGSIDEDVQGRNTLNDVNIGIEHQFTRRLSSGLSGSHQLFRSQDPGQVDSQAFGVDGSLNYRLDVDHSVGLSAGSSAQFYESFPTEAKGDDLVARPRSRSIVVQVQPTWTWQVFPETLFSAGVGPAFIETRQNSCDCFPTDFAEATESNFTWFASASISQRLGDNFRGRLGYQRSEGAVSGTGGTSVRDSLNASLNWQVSERLSSTLLGSWVKRNSATTLDSRTSGSDIDSTSWSLGLRGSYQITRQLSGSMQLNYRNQDNGGSTSNSNNYDNFEAYLGLTYLFDRVSLFE